jgi:hypothetical protein
MLASVAGQASGEAASGGRWERALGQYAESSLQALALHCPGTRARICSMRLAPRSEKVGGGGGAPRKPPSRKGQYAKGPDGKQNERCICCKLEGASLPAGRGNCTQRGLQMLGHLDTKKDMAVKDLRFAPWNEREIEWIKKTETKKEHYYRTHRKQCYKPDNTGYMPFKEVKSNDGRCWLFDKEERTRKAAAYFAQRRIAAAAAEETV